MIVHYITTTIFCYTTLCTFTSLYYYILFIILAFCSFGLLHIVALSPVLEAFAGLLLLDLIGAYLVHFIEHKVKFLWKFHMVHHADTHVDTTTANTNSFDLIFDPGTSAADNNKIADARSVYKFTVETTPHQ